MDFFEALKPFMDIYRMCGVGPYVLTTTALGKLQYRTSPNMTYYSIFVLLIELYVVYAVILSSQLDFMSLTSITEGTKFLQTLVGNVLILQTCATALWNQESILDILKVLESVGKELHVPREVYKNYRSKFALQLGLFFLFLLVMDASYALLMDVLFVLILIEIPKLLTDLQYCNLAYVIGDMFARLTERIEDFCDTQKRKGVENVGLIARKTQHVYTVNLTVPNGCHVLDLTQNGDVIEVLRSFSKSHGDLYLVVKHMNEIFGVRNVLAVCTAFLNITQSSYLLVETALGLNKAEDNIGAVILVATILDCSYRLAKVLNILWCCSLVGTRSEQLAFTVSKLQTSGKTAQIRHQMNIFSSQLVHRKIHFTACGFFPIDATLLYSIVGGVTTYLVILIQFRQSAKSV